MAALSPAVMELAMSRNPEKDGDFFERYQLRAFHYALQILGNREDAMDVTQEAFLRVHRCGHRRDSSRPFAPWFYAILRNLAIDQLRRRKARKEAPAENVPEMLAGPGPEVLAERSELKVKVWESISRLPEMQREVVILRDLHGLTYAEIGETLGVPLSTVKSRLHDARERLRRRLEGYL